MKTYARLVLSLLSGTVLLQLAYADKNTLTVKNKGANAQILKTLTGQEASVCETFNPNVCLAAGATHTQTFNVLACPIFKNVVWCNKPAQGSDKSSTQDFGGDCLPPFEYTLMFSSSVHIKYAFNNSSLQSSTSVPEGNTINVVNGVDQSGAFPSTVLFRNASTMALYTGLLVSEGDATMALVSVVPTLGTWGLMSLLVGALVLGVILIKKSNN